MDLQGSAELGCQLNQLVQAEYSNLVPYKIVFQGSILVLIHISLHLSQKQDLYKASNLCNKEKHN